MLSRVVLAAHCEARYPLAGSGCVFSSRDMLRLSDVDGMSNISSMASDIIVASPSSSDTLRKDDCRVTHHQRDQYAGQISRHTLERLSDRMLPRTHARRYCSPRVEDVQAVSITCKVMLW